MIMALALLLQLCACGKAKKTEKADKPSPFVIEAPQVSAETEPGYITTELPMPEGFQNLSGLQSVDDSLFFHAETPEGGFAVLRYDTLTDEWKSWILDTGEANLSLIHI